MTHASKNITLPQTSFAGGNNENKYLGFQFKKKNHNSCNICLTQVAWPAG